MPALPAGPGVVRHLVGRQLAGFGQLARRPEQRQAQLLVGKPELSRVAQPLEDRVGLDGQLVKRHVVADEVERAGELGPPLRLALCRPAVDQVEAEAGKERGGEVDCGERLLDRVPAAERLEIGVVQRLDPDR